MRISRIAVGTALALAALLAWSQQRKPDVIVDGNWQAAPSSPTARGSMAWFFDAAQNRVLVCQSTQDAPAPICHAGMLRSAQ